MDDVNLLDLDEASQQQQVDEHKNLLIDFELESLIDFDVSKCAHTKAASWSEPPTHFDIFSLEDLINSRKDNPTRPTRTQSLYEPSSHSQRHLRKHITPAQLKKLDFKSLRLSKPQMLPNSPSLLDALDRDKSLNGYIKHELPGSWRETTNEPSTSQKLIDLKNEQQDSDDDDDDDNDLDEVFHLSRAKQELNFRKPLLNNSSKSSVGKKVRFRKDTEEAEIVCGDDDFGDPSPTIRGGKSWRERALYFSMFLLANLILAIVVVVIVYISKDGLKKIGLRKSAVKLHLSPCDSIKSVYAGNFTSEHAGIFSSGPVRIIESSKFDGHLLIVPYGAFCMGSTWGGEAVCEPGGVMAINPSSLQLAWSYAPQGQMASLVCGADLNGDATQDCAITTSAPVSLDVISGVRGHRLFPQWLPEGIKRIHPVQWVPDMDYDRKPELLVTLETLEGDVDILLLMSTEWNHPSNSKRLLISVQGTTATDSAKVWRSGDGVLMVVAIFEAPLGNGVYMWSFWDLYFQKFEQREILLSNYTVGAPAGVFANLKGGGSTQLVLCTDDGTLVANNRDKQIWSFKSSKGTCISDSLGFSRWSNGTHRLHVFSRIKMSNSDETQIVVVNGSSGGLLATVDTSPGMYYDSPLALQMLADAGDWLMYWRRRKERNELVATDSKQTTSIIVNDDRLVIDVSTADEEKMESAELINRRYTPSFYVQNSTAFVLYATSAPINGEWRIIVHKLNVTCACNNTATTCTRLKDTQGWSSYRGINSDGYFRN